MPYVLVTQRKLGLFVVADSLHTSDTLACLSTALE